MKGDFSILPWEHRGSDFDLTPHAMAWLEVGGRKRDFALKMREGVVYFKEPTHVPVWAVTTRFECELRGEELVQAWKNEMSRDNFGRFVVYRPNFPDTNASTILAMVHRADGSGWVREWFRPDWLEVPPHRDAKQVKVWGDKFQNATRRAFRHTQWALLNCALSEEERRPLPPSWKRGDEAELRRVFALVMRVYARPRGLDYARTWSFAACNPASNGGFLDTFNPVYHLDLQFSLALGPLIQLLQTQFVWTGMMWRSSTQNWRQHLIQEMARHWGENWRGYFSPSTPQIKIILPPGGELSSHEKLESLLELRDWLGEKVTAKQSARLLADALD